MRSIVAAILVLSGFGVAGWVVVDDTGDDIGEVTVAADTLPAAVDTPTAPPATARVASPDRPAGRTPSGALPAADRRDGLAIAGTARGGVDDDATRSPAAGAPDIGRSSARIADVDLARPPSPADLRLPSIGVDAEVVPVGVDADGLMTVPEDVDVVGWYRWGATPSGGAGTTVLAGHVDSRSQGRGAFFDLRALEVGDEVAVGDKDGGETTWRVTGRRTYDKSSLPVDDLYRRDGRRRLVLITCGGEFDADVRSYRSNVVVEAEPVA